MPGLDGEGHHGQLGEDEGSKADGHHVDKLVLEQKQSAEHNDTSLQEKNRYLRSVNSFDIVLNSDY